MRKVYEKNVKHPVLIVMAFLIAVAVSAVCSRRIQVNYDMNDYLPEGTASTVAIDLMGQEFDGGIPNARVMIKDVSIVEALEYKKKLEAIDGVTDVMWLDDTTAIGVPLQMQDQETVEKYYVDDNALFTVTIVEEKRIEAVNAIRDLIGDDNAMTGSAVSTATATQSTVKEIARIGAIGVLFVFLVLMLTTTSWVEPVIVMFGLGVAIIINAGSNLIFGEISFVTNAAGNILQLAVSLDYSVFLIHRFTECRKNYENTKAGARRAMVDALTMSTSSILSSGLTTVIGFLALCMMQFQIGPDLGRALAKGIAISLITVFVFMPAVILATYQWIDKTTHKSFLPDFHGFGNRVVKWMLPMVVVFGIAVIPSFLASNANSFYYGASKIFGMNTKLGQDTQEIQDIFGKNDTYVILVPRGDKQQEQALSDALQDVPAVTNIISYVDILGTGIPEDCLDQTTLQKLYSDHYARMVLTVSAEYEGEDTFALVEQIRSIAQQYYPDTWYLAGEGVSTYDLMDTITADMTKVNFAAIAAVFLVLLLTMKSLVLPVILVLSIETAVWINLSIPYVTHQTIFYIAYLIISSVQLGATVDYAILLTDRYKEMRTEQDKKTAIRNTIASVTASILTSGSVLTVVGFLLGVISTHGLLSQLGYFLGKGTICSLVIVLFVLPGLLYLFDGCFIRKKK